MNLFYRKSETEELFITIVVATLERIGEEVWDFMLLWRALIIKLTIFLWGIYDKKLDF